MLRSPCSGQPCDHKDNHVACNDAECPCECVECRNVNGEFKLTDRYNIHSSEYGISWSRMINGYVYEFWYYNGKAAHQYGYRNALIVRRTKVYRNVRSEISADRMFHNVTRVNYVEWN